MAGRAAIRYAKAVLGLATEKNLSEVISGDMVHIVNTIAEHDELNEMLKSAVIKSDIKHKVLSELFGDVNGLTKGLFDVLITNKRIDILADVAFKYGELYDAQIGKEKATVTTAVPMTSEMEMKVLSKIKELTDKAVELENVVDEGILGGFILRVGDKQYNASIANQLNRLKREFTLN
ncbi:MAG: ATP synthase F1 subunit delta [Flavobacteriaceae bacterium]|nr:ATP synthase F1 subunit delta [Bacteroidia bacterium]NNF75209.1 ATP synthase F1 subunit delta [Flavobacteriaceae bacterium]NNK74315.1 ATP synthase F1 subunit delta [Flavobacteriaceae bacterium]